MIHWIFPLAAPFVCFVDHLLWRKAVGPLGQRGVAIMVLAVGLGFALVTEAGAGFRIYSFLVASLLGYAYFHFFNMASTARRIEILIRQYRGDTGSYGAGEMVAMRIARLETLGVVERSGGEIHLKPGLLSFVAAVLEGMRRLFYPK